MSENATQETTSQAGRAGFIFGLIGAAVRRDKKVVDYRFVAKDGDKKVADFANVEAPYPTTDKAAKEMAADCEFTVYTLDGGEYKEVKLKGLSAAVAIARDGRPVETLRGRLRQGKINEKELRDAAIQLYGFSAGDAPKPEVSAADIAGIMADEKLSPEERLAKMTEMLAAARVTVK